jgi:hypothetical protein
MAAIFDCDVNGAATALSGISPSAPVGRRGQGLTFND